MKNNMQNNVFEKVKYNCIGCGLCESICPKNCINIKEKSNIGILPYVDDKKCVNCGLCLEVCPVNLIGKKEELNNIKGIFIGKSKNEQIIKNSSSGGIVSSIIIDLFRKNEIDAALVAFYDRSLNIYGDFITSEEEVLKHSGSFYHTSKMLKNITKIKNYKSVLFVGLPCQNAAFVKFKEKFNIQNDYARISLFCTIGRMKNGIYKFLKENKIDFEKEIENSVTKYKSRYGTRRPGDIILDTEKKENIKFSSQNYFLSNDYFYTPNGCLNCKKLFGVEFSDISVGDNWGIETKEKIAIFTANTEKGLELIKNNNLIHLNKSNIEALKKSQPLGYPLKYKDRNLINKKIKFLKFIYRISPKNRITKKVLYKLRSSILKGITRRQNGTI
ncbi:MAG: Coenzyme F420 hydrogenase/dehydrogenase, beta subunit C-terminal domain [Thermosipho sp. (in: Bacteria)]|nr:Coenzyme F420 hydrogenase/dehydrogenase, beta subunit C-terminal domain [Thermosipho sp. (in: thermotogales)]